MTHNAPDGQAGHSERLDDQDALYAFMVEMSQMKRMWRRKLDEAFRYSPLSPTRWLIMRHVATADALLSQSRLAERIGMEGGPLVRQLDYLQKAGLITRRSVTDDKRIHHLVLTAEGKGELARGDGIVGKFLGAACQDISPDDIAIARSVFNKIVARLSP